MQSIRFPSLLNPNKYGFEFTNDSMTFWDTSYRHGGVLHCSMGFYETYGDNNTQHTPLAPCRAAHAVDYLVSLVSFILANPETEFEAYRLRVDPVNPETARFLAGIAYREDKRQWYNLAERKVSSAESKQHDKRWTQVPSWADGTISSAVSLFTLPDESHGPRELLERYVMHHSFQSALRAECLEGKDFEKQTAYWAELGDEFHSAFSALQSLVNGRTSLENARRQMDCTIHNAKRTAMETAPAIAA